MKKERKYYFDLLELSVKENPDESHCRMLLAREYFANENYEKALEEYQKVLEYEKKKTFAKLNAPTREAKPKAEFGDDMPDTEEKGPVLFPMSTLPEEHLFKMQTAEAQATTSNAVQSEDDRQQIRRITVKL